MIGQTTILDKSVKAGAAINPFTIAKFGADDDTMVPGAASTDLLEGVFQHAAESGSEVRVMLDGISRVKLGGTVNRGDWVTSDASGQGVAAAPAAGTNANVIGKAKASGVSGDIIPVHLKQCRIQG